MDDLTVQRIKDAADIVDVVGEFVHLEKKGKEYQGLCPFHDDRHMGSFSVSPQKQMYMCFACGAGGDALSFVMRVKNINYQEALLWLAAKYGINAEGAERYRTMVRQTPPKPKQMPVEDTRATLQIPLELVKGTTARLADDAFYRWVHSLPWMPKQRARIEKVMKNYCVGHAAQGLTMFWQVDDKGYVRTANMIRYNPDGHRYKKQGDDDRTFANGYAHALLKKHPKYGWDDTKVKPVACLYGLHLIDLFKAPTVNIVESEKTAILASVTWGSMDQQVWMATCGEQKLNRALLQPLINRDLDIVLYPDKDAEDAWKEKAKQIGYERLYVNTNFMQTYWREEDGPKADIGDILVRMMTKPEQHTEPAQDDTLHAAEEAIERLSKQNPAINILIDKLELKAYRINERK